MHWVMLHHQYFTPVLALIQPYRAAPDSEIGIGIEDDKLDQSVMKFSWTFSIPEDSSEEGGFYLRTQHTFSLYEAVAQKNL